MTPSLIRLPTAILERGDFAHLAACADAVAARHIVLIGPQRTHEGHELDAFVVAAAVAQQTVAAIGVAARVGAGRAASIVAREATAAQLVGACNALLLEGDVASCRDAAAVIAALFEEGTHTVITETAHVHGARNLPTPDVEGGPAIYWRDHADLWEQTPDGPRRCGEVREAPCSAPVQTAAPGMLVVLDHPVAAAAELAASLAT